MYATCQLPLLHLTSEVGALEAEFSQLIISREWVPDCVPGRAPHTSHTLSATLVWSWPELPPSVLEVVRRGPCITHSRSMNHSCRDMMLVQGPQLLPNLSSFARSCPPAQRDRHDVHKLTKRCNAHASLSSCWNTSPRSSYTSWIRQLLSSHLQVNAAVVPVSAPCHSQAVVQCSTVPLAFSCTGQCMRRMENVLGLW